MSGYVAFVKKELLENLRTFKMLILFLIFFIFGMMSPLTAKLMPEILSQMPLEGMTITIPEPSALDSYTQFFKNMTQMGMVVLLLVFSGTLTQELLKGTLVNMLTKGLSRYAVILSKFTVALLLWTVGLVISFITMYGYTAYFFSMEGIENVLVSVGCLWLFGVFLLAFLMFAQTLVSSQYGTLLLTAMGVGILFILNIFPNVQKFNPLKLVSDNVVMLSPGYELSSLGTSLGITIGLSVLFLGTSLYLFKNKRI